MAPDQVQLTRTDAVATVRFSRPEAHNALDRASRQQLLATLRQVAVDGTVRCLILTGSGRTFCVGQDLNEHVGKLRTGDLDALWSSVAEEYSPIALALQELGVPVVAALNGVAAGAGASLAFLADYRVASRDAALNLAFANLALPCDTGCSWTLPRLVGPAKALELLMTPRTIPADEALALGLVSEVVESAEFDARVAGLGARFAAGPTLAYAALRQAVAYSGTHDLPDALANEAVLMRRTGASADHRAAVEAFLAKRSATFEGR